MGVYLATAGLPKLLDKINPLNETRPKIYLYKTEYFVDQDDYYKEILIHAYLTVPLSVGVIIYFDNMLACYISFANGMFAIVSKHLKNIHVLSETDQMKSTIDKHKSIFNRLKYCIKIHSSTIEFIELAESSTTLALLFVAGLNTVVITVTGIVSVMKIDKPSEASRYMAFTLGGIFHLYYISFLGNQLIQGSASVHRACYDNEWYTLPINYQKLLIPIMMRSKKPCQMTAVMSILESPDFLLSKRILKLYGQWPYSSGVINYIKRIYCFVAVISILIPKLIKIYESRHDVDAFILCMPMVAVHIEAIINLTSWCTSGEEIKYLIETIKRDWDILKSGDEIAILDGHWKRGRSNINNYAYPMVGITLVFMTSPAIPLVCDIIAPLNESRPRVFLYETEYFVDQDEYYFHILIHEYMTVPLSIALTVYYNTVLGSWIYHATGMLAIVSYQLENMHVLSEGDKAFKEHEKNQNIYERLTYCIKLHSSTIEFIEIIESSNSLALFLVILICTLIFVITGVVSIVRMDHRYVGFSIGVLGTLFFLSFIGNEVIKASEAVHIARSEGSQLTSTYGETTRLIITNILFYMFFDGKPQNLKVGKLAKRVAAKEKTGNAEDIDKFNRQLVKVTPEHVNEAKQLLKLMGIPYIEYLYLLNCTQCAALVKGDKVYAAATEDMDALTFGSTVLLCRLTMSEARKLSFIDFCILLGCDYTGSIKGIGPKRAIELIKTHKSLEKILENIDQKKYPSPEDWNYKEARALFIEPDVADPKDIDLKWTEPDEEGLVKFLCGDKNFNEDRIRNGAKKLAKARTTSTEGRPNILD
ncbi:hypothetical protein HCN44_010710 [Aphidius gifuensis]|uniref:XPG-I domain-containing protein n=1 Tax=Aphidius gifuensis TaxID=684658 RepID=A0A835CQL5_APHGI|nr:hypothetical protein HCN44_010710 [Aphidius gifuensis]